MNKRCGGDQRIALILPVGNMKVSTTSGNIHVDGKNASSETRQNLRLKPMAQGGALYDIAFLHLQSTDLKLHDADRRDKEVGRRSAVRPLHEAGIRFAKL